jgi:hypothetical protein
MESWQNGKLMKWQVDKMADSRNDIGPQGQSSKTIFKEDNFLLYLNVNTFVMDR